MSTKYNDLLKNQTEKINGNNSNYGDEEIKEPLIEREQIKGTPFWIIKTEGKYTLVMGKHRLNDQELYSKQEVYQYLENEKWSILLIVILIVQNDKTQIITKEIESIHKRITETISKTKI